MSEEQTPDSEVPEPTDEQLDDLLERFAADQPREIDEGRFRAMLDDIVEHARAHPQLGAGVRALESQGAHLYSKTLHDDWMEIRLGFDDDPVARPKSHGRSIPLGKFPLSRVLKRPQG
jgi:hypothetical protein